MENIVKLKEKQKFVVGIDLALKKTGVSVFYLHGEAYSHFDYRVIQHKTFWNSKYLEFALVDLEKTKDIYSKAMIIKSTINKLIAKIAKENQINPQSCGVEIIVELGNYGNAKMTCNFAQLYGNLECYYKYNTTNLFGRVSITPIAPNDWFNKLNKMVLKEKPTNAYNREQRKEISVQKANEFFGLDNKSNDISDSIWIAYYGINQYE